LTEGIVEVFFKFGTFAVSHIQPLKFLC